MRRSCFWANVLVMLFVGGVVWLLGWLLLRAANNPGAWYSQAANQALVDELYQIQGRAR